MNSFLFTKQGKLVVMWLILSSGLSSSIFAVWVPPVGIPEPAFGIKQAHTMYTGRTFDFGTGPVTYPTAGNGPYTHYVNMNHPAATDGTNVFGSPDRPRKTIPGNLPPGSVVEIHGGPYNFRNYSDKMALYGYGTSTRPIFFRGASTNERPVFSKDVTVFGTYLICENLEFKATRLTIRADIAGTNAHHLSFRHFKMVGTSAASDTSAAIGGIGSWSDPSKPWVSNVVVYANCISDYGDWRPTASENDVVGVAVAGYNAADVWIVDNDIFRTGGDSVRVGSNPTAFPYTSRYAYIGRNRFHDNHENAVDVKGILNVMVSENVMYGFSPSSSDSGSAVVVHYNPVNVWLVANEIHHAAVGVTCSGVQGLYIINNSLHDVKTGIQYWSRGDIHIVNNTIARMTFGIRNMGASGTYPHPIINNIISSLTDPTNGFHVYYGDPSLTRNNFFNQENGAVRTSWKSSVPAGYVERDPLFVNAADSNFRLRDGSPAIDTGADVSFYAKMFQGWWGRGWHTDVVGNLRFQGTAIDIGAFEFSPPVQPEGGNQSGGTRFNGFTRETH